MKSERGAILIQVSLMLVGLLVFSALVLDYGVLWASRGQAQNAADAGALGAAVHLMYNPAATTDAVLVAKKLAGVNAIWTEQTAAGNVDVFLPVVCPPGAPTGTGCVKVDVYRNQARGNPLPTFFAHLVGVTDQGVRATATAIVTSGNAVQCIKPFAVPDKWADNDESGGGWDQGNTFSPPTDTFTLGSGFDANADFGYELVLKPGNGQDWSAGWMQLLSFDGSGSGADVNAEILGCPSEVPTVGIYDGTAPCDSDNDADPPKGCVAVKNGTAQGPVVQNGIDVLIELDDDAMWTGSGITGGCMDTPGSCLAINPAGIDLSPRIVPVALFNPAAYYATGCSGSNCAVQVTNIIGFFIEGTCFDVYGSSFPTWCGSNPADAKKAVLGRIINYPGQYLSSAGPALSSFTQTVRLVR
jgi:Flp pilus assembly protein TadG